MTIDVALQEQAGAISARFTRAYEALGDMAEHLAPAVERSLDGSGRLPPLSRELQEAMREASAGLLEKLEMPFGAGVIFSAERLVNPDKVIEWWVRSEKGGLEPFSFVHRSDDRDFYDFQHLPWFSVVRDMGVPALAGPYIDWLGVDEYIVTLSMPLRVRGEFYGVVGCDVSIETLERVLLGGLRHIPTDVAFVNDDRIVVGNTARFLVGERIRVAPDDAQWVHLETPIPGLRLLASPRLAEH